MKRKRIAIIGHFGGKEAFYDGQTIKTKILYQELITKTDWNIKKVDTYFRKTNPGKLVLDTFRELVLSKQIIILLSGNGMRVYLPLLCFFSKFFRKKVYHDVIGGNLDDIVKRTPKYKKYLCSFAVNWVETGILKQNLAKLGIHNTEVLPNFKRLNVVSEENLQQNPVQPYRFCTFSRVMREKGIEDAISAIEGINNKAGNTICTLDIYGRVDEGYTDRFDQIMKNVSSAVKYCGMVPFDQSTEVLSGYYAMLFPTFWNGEGFAGTVVDSFSAGLPIIATDFNSNSEIVKNKSNGILYPNEEMKTLEDAVAWAIDNPKNILGMKKTCVVCAKDYQPDSHIKNIISTIERV